jgi:hypothetical protein
MITKSPAATKGAPKPRRNRLRCQAQPLRAAVPGKITKVTLDISYDDSVTWTKVTLAKGANGYWAGSFRPAKKAGGFIPVRASAETNSGYSIKQEIIRAYGLR